MLAVLFPFCAAPGYESEELSPFDAEIVLRLDKEQGDIAKSLVKANTQSKLSLNTLDTAAQHTALFKARSVWHLTLQLRYIYSRNSLVS